MPETSIPWAEVRRAYCETPATIAQICAAFAITPSLLRSRREAEGWPARPSASAAANAKSGRLPATATDAASLHRRVKKPVRKAHRITGAPCRKPARSPSRQAAIIERFYNAIDLKLNQLEQQMSGNPDTSSADHEREVRAISTLIQTFERMLEFDPASRPAFDADGNARSHPTGAVNARSVAAVSGAGSADAERLRREIAERLGRIMEKWNAPGSSG